MKTFGNTLAVLLGATFLGVGTASATEIFRAHYEIRVDSAGTDNKVRSTFETKPGERFTLDLPPNVVAMAVRRLNAENYELQVTVTPTKEQKGRARPRSATPTRASSGDRWSSKPPAKASTWTAPSRWWC